MAAPLLEGQCHCGQVKVSIAAETPGVIACHCGDCQKLHGNFFALLAAERGSVQWSGTAAPQWYQSSARVQRAFCPNCGSRLAKDAEGPPKVLMSAGLFKHDLPRQLVRQVYIESKPDWYALPSSP